MNFIDKKKQYLDALYKPDKSKKGYVDEKISSLLDKINSLNEYITTSSCSGRILLISKPDSNKKTSAEWIYVSHNQVSAQEIYSSLEESVKKTNNAIWFKVESPILHIMCKDIIAAEKIVTLARNSGFKYSGIFVIKEERVMVHIFGTNTIETICAKNNELVVDETYIETLVDEANNKMKKNHNTLSKFEESINSLK